MEQRTDKSLEGSGGYILEKIFSTDLHELEKQPKTKVGRGGNLPLPGDATDHETERYPPSTTLDLKSALSYLPLSLQIFLEALFAESGKEEKVAAIGQAMI